MSTFQIDFEEFASEKKCFGSWDIMQEESGNIGPGLFAKMFFLELGALDM